MTFILLQHQWKSFWRSRSAGRNLAMQIFIGFIVLYLIATAVLLGLSLNRILLKAFPGEDSIKIFFGFILYYFAFDFVTRFVMQDLPTLAVQPYLAQNIKKKKLVRFLNIRSLFSAFTLLPFFIFLPFIITAVGSKYGAGISLALAVSIFGLTFFNHFMVLFVKRKTILSQWWLLGFFAVILTVIAADYFGLFSLRSASVSLFSAIISFPWLSLLFVLLAAAAYYNNSIFLQKNFYLENLERSAGQKKSADYNWLQRFGNIGDLIAIDLKLILRNKRPRSLLMLSVIFLFYGFIFFKPQYLDHGRFGIVLMGAIFVSGMFMMGYGQFLFAWQSNHFDGLLASNISIKTYLKSKITLLISFSTVSFLLSLMYGFMNWKLIPILIAAWLFNVGIHSVLTGFIATRNYKALDLSKGSSFNYQGTGATQWLYSFVVLIIGGAIYLPFALLINNWAGIAAIGILGLISFFMQDFWLDKLAVQFHKRKYKILEGFREK